MSSNHHRAHGSAEETEQTPLFAVPPSPSSTNDPSYASLPQATSGNSLYHDAADDHSAGSLELEIPAYPADHDDRRYSINQVWNSLLGKTLIVGLIIASIAWSGVVLTRPASARAATNVNHSTNNPAVVPSDHSAPLPFSFLNPVWDMHLFKLVRPKDTAPSPIIHRKEGEALPTNQWFENFLLNRGKPTALQRAYTVPYVVDVVGTVPGMQLHPPHIMGSKTVVQLTFVEPHGLTLGCSSPKNPSTKLTHEYSVLGTTSLGITLEWDAFPMTASIVRGMPYATMIYPAFTSTDGDGDGDATTIVPTIASLMPFRGNPIADGKTEIKCDGKKKFKVNHELQLTVDQSDFTWIAFFSRPVMLYCNVGRTEVYFEAADEEIDDDDVDDLVARLALLSNCTANRNPQYCEANGVDGINSDYADVLRTHADLYPGTNTNIKYEVDDENNRAMLTLDWDVQSMSGDDGGADSELINYALPHQLDHLDDPSGDFCTPAMLGRACLLKGSTWAIPEPLPSISFLAPRPPRPSALKALSEALQDDLGFHIPDNYMRGAGDTYFSGKMLAKQGRVLVIADEVNEICTQSGSRVPEKDRDAYKEACDSASVPTSKETQAVLDLLRAGVEIWINGTAEAPFVYDEGWGGVVSCGCHFNGDTQSCENIFPDCPILDDPGLNFGNGFYNDHHFHYGYHVYAAAVVAKYDPAWGRKHFEQVKLLIRDFANPSPADDQFPLFRHKDWYEGHSWASGITLPPYLNGKNQESSSEAIAAYEAVALYGKVMVDAWKDCPGCKDEAQHRAVAQEIKNVGRLLTGTEIRVTERYWHVRLKDEALRIYPKTYAHNVIGILWNTMAQFQTWFGNAPFLPYGIQLLPITAISEQRDDIIWLREMYKPFADACNADAMCEEQGWSVSQLGVMATVGHVDFAMDRVQALPSEVFESAGGNGHSRSNTMWFIATRLEVDPIPLPKSDTPTPQVPPKPAEKLYVLSDCDVPDTCTDAALDKDANGYTCRERIKWIMQAKGKSQYQACARVAGLEFITECGACKPAWNGEDIDVDDDSKDGDFTADEASQCPPCSEEICSSDLNRCPIYDRTFVCSDGPNRGGCQGRPWGLDPWQCNKCCEMTHCPTKVAKVKAIIDPSVCPPCEPEICRNRRNLCPVDAAPYLCIEGISKNGCSPRLWDVAVGDCTRCCTVLEGCAALSPPWLPV